MQNKFKTDKISSNAISTMQKVNFFQGFDEMVVLRDCFSYLTVNNGNTKRIVSNDFFSFNKE